MGTALFTVDALRALEADAARTLPHGTLMQRAGAAAAGRIAQRLGAAPKAIAIVCGSGNNGGDGYVCALELEQRGHHVECFALAPPSTVDAKAAAAAWRAIGGAVHDSIASRRTFDATVDAMFGIGLTRPLDGPYRQAAEWINAHRGLRVALDVPSGLDADRGAWVGGKPGVTADLTITFLGAKPGLFTGAGCDAAGEVIVEPIGVDPLPAALRLLDQTDFATVTTPRARDSHKGDYGNVGVLGGGAGMVGAPLLAARAALRMGAGRVFVECIGARDLQFDPLHPELMLRALPTIERLDAVVVGCGLGGDADARAALDWALGARSPVVFDADALNLLARDPALRARLRVRGGASILTPHPLEAARLLGATAAQVQADRIGRALFLARETNATVVLKGAGTVIATSDGRAWINTTGGPALATPGSGDVLGGMIGALLAQQFSPLHATSSAVWLHGAAARRHRGDIGLVAGDIAALAVQCLVDLRAGASARP
jgi:hydroxyethylthiazole kinase-like uncharacterized protein yjeF